LHLTRPVELDVEIPHGPLHSGMELPVSVRATATRDAVPRGGVVELLGTVCYPGRL
jgi:hypothetical protein